MKNLNHLNEQDEVYSEQHAKELLAIKANYNKMLQELNNKLAKQITDLSVKHLKINQAKQQLAQTKQVAAKVAGTQTPSTTQTTTGTVDKAGNPVNADGSPATKESYSDILKVKEKLNEEIDIDKLKNIKDSDILWDELNKFSDMEKYKFLLSKKLIDADRGYWLRERPGALNMKLADYLDSLNESLNEENFDTRYADSETVQDLKDYMDAENISYIEDEDKTTLDFDEEELDPEWEDRLDDLGLEKVDDGVETDDILDYAEDEEEPAEDEEPIEDEKDITDTHKEIDEEKVFYVDIRDADGDFTGKVYKLFDDGEWHAKIVDGDSGTFEQLHYDPSWDEFDVIAFLRENYDDAELIDKEKFNDHVEEPEEEVEEGHKIQTYKEFLNETR